jgi:hypothetical protein
LWLLACLLTATGAQAQPKSCDQLKTEIAARIRASGVNGFALSVVPSEEAVPAGAEVVGDCESGTKKILYRRLALKQALPKAEIVAPKSPVAQARESRVVVAPTVPVVAAAPANAAKTEMSPPPVAAAPEPVPAPRAEPPAPLPPAAPPTHADSAAANKRLSEALQGVDQAMARMTQAQIAFNTPQVMNMGDAAQIELLLSLDETQAQLKRALGGEGGRESAQVAVTEQMEARLTGANFRITAVTPEAQAITSNGRTAWQWEVQPTVAGSHPMHLTLNAVLRVDGTSVRRTVKTFDKTILVQVTVARQVSDFVGQNWQWLWAVVVAPLVGWFWRGRRQVHSQDGAHTTRSELP